MGKLEEVSNDAKKYEIEDALRTLKRAEEIKMDSGLMAEVSKLAATEKKTLSGIAGLRAKYNKMAKAEGKPDLLADDVADSKKPEEETAMPTEEGELPKQLEENSYINRAKAAEEATKTVNAEIVKIQDDSDDEKQEEEGD